MSVPADRPREAGEAGVVPTLVAVAGLLLALAFALAALRAFLHGDVAGGTSLSVLAAAALCGEVALRALLRALRARRAAE